MEQGIASCYTQCYAGEKDRFFQKKNRSGVWAARRYASYSAEIEVYMGYRLTK